MFVRDYVEWSVKLLFYVGGVGSTIAGSWVSSKIRLYHDARNSHRDELQEKVLKPLRETLGLHETPRFTVLYQAQQHNPQAASTETPNTYGPEVVLELPGDEPSVDETLFEDARLHHYYTAIESWEELKKDWTAQCERHKTFIEGIAQEILAASNLPAFPAPPGPYVMHRALGTFVYKRLVLNADIRLWTQEQQDGQIPNCHVLNDGQVTAAKGSEQQMRNLTQWVDGVLVAKRGQANELREAVVKLNERGAVLSRQLSLAIAEKKLRGPCSLVRFF